MSAAEGKSHPCAHTASELRRHENIAAVAVDIAATMATVRSARATRPDTRRLNGAMAGWKIGDGSAELIAKGAGEQQAEGGERTERRWALRSASSWGAQAWAGVLKTEGHWIHHTSRLLMCHPQTKT